MPRIFHIFPFLFLIFCTRYTQIHEFEEAVSQHLFRSNSRERKEALCAQHVNARAEPAQEEVTSSCQGRLSFKKRRHHPRRAAGRRAADSHRRPKNDMRGFILVAALVVAATIVLPDDVSAQFYQVRAPQCMRLFSPLRSREGHLGGCTEKTILRVMAFLNVVRSSRGPTV